MIAIILYKEAISINQQLYIQIKKLYKQEMSSNSSSLVKEYGMEEKLIPLQKYVPNYGEIFFCDNNIRGWQSIQGFKGKKILNISGGVRKTFVFEDVNELENTLSALHQPEYDYIEFEGKTSLPIQELITSIEGNDKILSIECGKTHNLILTEQGKIFSFGYGEYGALGLGGSIFEQKPRLVRKIENRKIVSVACGMHHSLALTQYGDAYAWGRGFEGQLGISPKIESTSSPTLITAFNKYQKGEISKLVKNPIIKIATGSYHSIAVDINQNLYCWGEARYGQTGTGKKIKEPLPVKVEISLNNISRKIEMIAGGFGHTLCLTTQGQIFSWGLNVKGQLGLCDQAESEERYPKIETIRAKFYPTLVETDLSKTTLPKFKFISCGYNRSFAIDVDGFVWAWGGGNLGFKDSNSERAPRKITENVDERKFTHLFANQDCLTGFALQTLKNFVPNCVPSNGATEMTFFGSGFVDTGKQQIKFTVANYPPFLVEANFDETSETYYAVAPNFGEIIASTKEKSITAQIAVSMDGIYFLAYDQALIIYPQSLTISALQPKSGATSGNTEIKLDIDIPEDILKGISHITVGFQSINLTKTNQNKKGVESWICVEGTYSHGEIVCRTPKIQKFDHLNPLYNVDISLNGQQFTEKPNTFRFYELSNLGITPIEGLPEGGYVITIQGGGLYDSNKIKVNLKTEVTHNQEKLQLGRLIETLTWHKNQKKFTFNMPPITWLLGHNEPHPDLIKAIKAVFIRIEITLSGAEWITVGQFRFVDPPPPPPEPQQQKKDSKKDGKKGAKK